MHYLLPWLLERGLCDPELAALYLGRKLLSKEAFAQAGKEYQQLNPRSYRFRIAGLLQS